MNIKAKITQHLFLSLCVIATVGFVCGLLTSKWLIFDVAEDTINPETYDECMLTILSKSMTDSAVTVGRTYCLEKFSFVLEGFTPEMFENNK